MIKNYRTITICLCLLLLVTLFAGGALGGGLYLTKGVGLRGTLEIGQKMAGAQGETWLTDKNTGLKYKINDQQLIILIKCDHDKCITDHNITVRTSKETLLRRYGLPDKKNKLKQKELNVEGGILYEYQGIGFGIDEEGIIKAIYIFPVFKKK